MNKTVLIVILSLVAGASSYFSNGGFFNTGNNNGNSGYSGYGNTNSGSGYGNTNSGSGYGNTNSGSGYGNTNTGSSNNGVYCPPQFDFSAQLQLSSDDSNYPVTDLNNDIGNNSAVGPCLLRTLILPNATVIPDDPVVLNSQETCPSTNQRLFSYSKFNNRCWVVPGFQESVNYTTCLTQRCNGCDTFFSTGQGYQKKCTTLYKYTTFWAFCYGLPFTQRVIRDRIPLPYACVCQKVLCYANPLTNSYWKK